MASHNDKTSVVDADSHFIIDPVTRTIQNDGEKNLVQFDHNSERKTFECPRFVEGHDMLNCNRVIVNYLDNDLPGVYEVDDLTMKDTNTVMFSWLISSNATQKTGNIFFAITFMCVQTNGDVTYRWNTAINQGLKVIEGMNQNSTIVYDNVDILEQWKQQLFGTSDGEISKIQEATNECLKQIPSDYSDLNTKVDKNTTSISELKESLKNVGHTFSLGVSSKDDKIYIYVDGNQMGDGINRITGDCWNITYVLNNSSLSYYPESILKGGSFSTLIIPNSEFYVSKVTVLMGDDDISSNVYKNNKIEIPEVLNDLTVKVETRAMPADISNPKLLNVDMTDWINKESVIDTVSNRTFDVASDDSGVNLKSSYYADANSGKKAFNEKGFTIAYVWDRSNSNNENCQFWSGIGNCYADLGSGTKKYPCISTTGPFYNGTGACNIYDLTNKNSIFADSFNDLPDIITIINSYTPEGKIIIYVNGNHVHTIELTNFSNWNPTGSAQLMNPDVGIRIRKNDSNGNYAKEIVQFNAYEGTISETDASKLHEYLIAKVSTKDIVTVSSLAMQVGDAYTLQSYVIPRGFDYKPEISIEDETIANVENGIITALKDGSTNVIMKCNDYSERFPLVVGTQIYNTDDLEFYDRDFKDILLVNPPKDMYVGEEFAIEAIGISSTGVPWTWNGDANTIFFKSSNTSVATVQFGVVRAISTGTATITAYNSDNTVAKSYDVTVTEENRWWENVEDSKIYKPEKINNTFDDFQTHINYAANNGFKKFVIPKNTYVLTPTDTPITIPENLCIDFNNSIIKMAESNQFITSKTGYATFDVTDKKNVILMNGTFYGENVYDWSKSNPAPNHIEQECMLRIIGNCEGTHVINCEFSYSPGFNVVVGHHFLLNTRTALKYTNVEKGGINEDGTNNDTATNTYRTKDFIDLSWLDLNIPFTLGNMQGYGGYAYMYSRLYTVWFFDSNKELISSIKYARQFAFYNFPSNAKYAKVEFYQTFAPTSGDGDFGGIAHFISVHRLRRLYFENCKFNRNTSTGLCPGGDRVILDNCYMEDSGILDPAACLDWEDGGQMMHSWILRNSKFKNTLGHPGYCGIRSPRSSSLVMHDNIFDETAISIADETEWFRIYRNWIKADVTLSTKYDSVFAGNSLVKSAVVKTVGGSKSQLFMADNYICIDNR